MNFTDARLLSRQECRVAIVDITQREQAQETVRLSEVRYRRLFEAAHDGVLILDPGTRKITKISRQMSMSEVIPINILCPECKTPRIILASHLVCFQCKEIESINSRIIKQ